MVGKSLHARVAVLLRSASGKKIALFKSSWAHVIASLHQIADPGKKEI